MCGIAGLVDLRGIDRAVVAPRLARAEARLAPRGPDGTGSWFGTHAAFVHRRLAIIALGDQGAQPMHGHGLSITYNGEIYNHAELRRALEQRGRRFTGESDTEVLLAGWAEWGEALLPRLAGMFAFALWDQARRELVLARDRFGKKPLVVHADGPSIAFASDQLALEHVVGRQFDLDASALAWLFALRWLPDGATFGRGAMKLGPGCLLRFSAAGPLTHQWYDLAAAAATRAITRTGDAGRSLVATFDEAVRARLVSDVPVGAFLSGGIDSALVAASMARSQARARTFTVGFVGAGFLDERADAAVVARHLGTEHCEVVLEAGTAADLLDDAVAGMDEPIADASAVPTFAVSRAMRHHVAVALSGDGADEVFGGYRRYQGELLAATWERLPWLARRTITVTASRLPERRTGGRLAEALRRARRFVSTAHADPVSRQAAWMQDVGDEELAALLHIAPPGLVHGLVAAARNRAGTSDPINAMLAVDIATTLPGDMLVKVDRMSMANGLEVRCPFLDHRVVEIAAAIPGDAKLRRGEGKRILREIFKDRLPTEVFRRPKRGFEIPVRDWLLGPLRPRLDEACDRDRLRRQGLIDPGVPQRWRQELGSGRRDTSWPLWTL
ncbi:MAG: asparagine synthase (glutamine-hydrolyzing), partial [Alphaproteobacteria bacterium]|nr:asparagine synthase (glutamine-hydrolyzing) [Alphaproteobacteria bacterium]